MTVKPIVLGAIVTLLIACQPKAKVQSTAGNIAEQTYQKASRMMLARKYDSAIVLLKQAFEQGFERPMGIVTDSNFYYLIDDPNYRPKVRSLLKAFSREPQATMNRPEEPGQPIWVKGRILEESSNQAVENVLVELVHADQDGLYFGEKSTWNPRIFAYLKTDKNGAFSIGTIQPGIYQDDEGNDVPSHIHFTLEADGYRVYASEFTFENDPIFKESDNPEVIPVAQLKDAEDESQFEVTIYVQKE